MTSSSLFAGLRVFRCVATRLATLAIYTAPARPATRLRKARAGSARAARRTSTRAGARPEGGRCRRGRARYTRSRADHEGHGGETPMAASHRRAPSKGDPMHKLAAGVLLTLSFAIPAFGAIREEPVTYKDGATEMKGFIVYDDAIAGKRPGIVLVHEWWGITKHVHGEASKFATQGYTAFIADMYGDGKTADNPKDAGALSGGVMKDPQAMQSRFNAAREALAKHQTVDPGRIGAVGYCF